VRKNTRPARRAAGRQHGRRSLPLRDQL